MQSSTAQVPTQSASRYLQQLCKHWAHDLEVTFDREKGVVRFPKEMRGMTFPEEAVITFTAHAEALECHIAASTPQQLDGMKSAVVRHVDRFAFREAPLNYDWVGAA